MQLPLWAYLLVSSAAIAGIAFMVWRLKPGQVPRLSPDDALRMFRSDFPRVESSNAETAADQNTVLILGACGSIVGCVTLIGLRWTARRIGARDVAGTRTDGSRLTLFFADFTWPALDIAWRNAAEAQDWAARFNAMRRPDHA